METLNSLLSNDIGYLDALRHAQAIPLATPVVIPPADIRLPAKMSKIPTWGWILAGVGVTIFAAFNWKKNQDNKKFNTL